MTAEDIALARRASTPKIGQSANPTAARPIQNESAARSTQAEAYPLVAAVVPVHNSWEHTQEFLDSLRKVTYPNFRTIIIDDGSTDGTAEHIRRDYPEVILRIADGSLWWGRSFNLGIEIAKEMGATYVLQLANDSIVAPGFLNALVDTAERNPNAIITSKIYYYDQPNVIIDAGGEFNWLWGGWKMRGYDEEDRGKFEMERDVAFGVQGFLIRTSFFDRIGGVDHVYFPHWHGEVDMLLRARKLGYRIIYQPQSRIWHKVARTAKASIYTTRRFLRNPLATFAFALSEASRGGPLNLRELFIYYKRHIPLWYVPYAFLSDCIRRIYYEFIGKR